MGQLQRNSGHLDTELVNLLKDPEEEIRANVVRILGDNRLSEAKEDILKAFTTDKSIRVRSLAAIATGRVFPKGDSRAIDSLYSAAERNGKSFPDIFLRHALLSALDYIGTEASALARENSKSDEERLLAVLFLRRKESSGLSCFLDDKSPLIRSEVVRAIYDTKAMDGAAGEKLTRLDPSPFSRTIQRRIMAANYRMGNPENATALMEMVGDSKLDMSVRKAALQGLLRWEDTVEADPVHGKWRPVPKSDRTLAALGKEIGSALQSFSKGKNPPALVALSTKLADATGVLLDEKSTDHPGGKFEF